MNDSEQVVQVLDFFIGSRQVWRLADREVFRIVRHQLGGAGRDGRVAHQGLLLHGRDGDQLPLGERPGEIFINLISSLCRSGLPDLKDPKKPKC